MSLNRASRDGRVFMTGHVNTRQLFYCDRQLHTMTGAACSTLFRSADGPLAERACDGPTRLFATDQNASVMHVNSASGLHTGYTPYGFHFKILSEVQLAAFNGERLDPASAAYALGNGYRLFSPGLMRFLAADTLSPFDQGGLNAYSYCLGDPINRTDPSGHLSLLKPRTWFRSPAQKIRQREKALNSLATDMREIEARILENRNRVTSVFDLHALDVLKTERANYKARLEQAQSKLKGINKYLPKDQRKRLDQFEINKALLIETNIQSPTRLPSPASRKLFSPKKEFHDPYDDANFRFPLETDNARIRRQP